MAKPRGNPKFVTDLLHKSTVVEVIRTATDGTSIKKTMLYGEWKEMTKQKGFTYRAFQLGFSQYKL